MSWFSTQGTVCQEWAMPGPEGAGDAAHLDGCPRTLSGLADGGADGLAQSVVLHRVEAEAARIHRRNHQLGGRAELRWPVLGVLQGAGIDGAHRLGQILAELPSAGVVHRQQHADLVVAEAVGVQLLKVAKRIVAQKSAHVRIPQRKREAADEALIREVEALIVVVGAA